MSNTSRALWLWALLAAPGAAFAHSPIDGIDTFYNGLLHPLFVPAQLLLLIALGLFIGQKGSEKNQIAIIALLIATVVGLAVAWTGGIDAKLEPALLAVAALIGLLTASNLAASRYLCAFIAILVGLLLGMDSTQESLTGKERLASLFGSGVGIYLLFLYPMAIADYANKRQWQKIGVRVVSSWVTASSMLVLVLSLSSLAAR